jgi:hypothetical protein
MAHTSLLRILAPWFQAPFIDEVRRLQGQGDTWVHLFDMVPDALTEDEEDEEDSAVPDAKSEADVANVDGGSDDECDESGQDPENVAGSNDDVQYDLNSVQISSSDAESDAAPQVASEVKAADQPKQYYVQSRRERRRRRSLNCDPEGSQSCEYDSDDETGDGDQVPSSGRNRKHRSNARNRRIRRQESGFYALQQQYGRQG